MKKLKVGIVGAGPAGLSAAIFLHRAGHHVVLFDQFSNPEPVGSGLLLQPPGMAVLDALGLLAPVLALGNRIERLSGTDIDTGRTVLDVSYSGMNKDHYGLAVNRAMLFDVLYQAACLAKIQIETGKQVVRSQLNSCSRDLEFSDGSRSGSFDLVVDATGARSKLHCEAKEPVRYHELRFGALWATLDWHDEGFEQHSLMQRYRKAHTMIGVLPTGKIDKSTASKMAFFWSLKPENLQSIHVAGLAALKGEIVGCWPETQVFLDQIDSFERFTLAKYGHHTMSFPAGRRIVFVGDSAHSTSPQLGQGANMALLDAAALAASFDMQSELEQALATYCKLRKRHVQLYQVLSYFLTPFYQSDSSFIPLVRDVLVGSLGRLPPVSSILGLMVTGMIGNPLRPLGLDEFKCEMPADRK